MDDADEKRLYEELTAIGSERTEHEAAVERLAERSRQAAKDALRQGMKPSRVARALRYTDGYVRKLRLEADLPPDPRYAAVKPPVRHIGFGEMGIGDTMEAAMANMGPIDYGTDLRAIVVAAGRQRIAVLTDRLRREDPEWYSSAQSAISTEHADVAVEILVHALAENRLAESDFTG